MVALLNPRWKDVLGMNARMLKYIRKVNSPESIRIANNKLATKRVLQKAGLPTPRMYATIQNRNELKKFNWTKLPASFVLKPAASSGGGGIIVVFGRNKKGNWIKADKSEIFIPELKSQVIDILDGNFSKGNVPDKAFFEQRVKVHGDLKPYSVKGVPDLRILLYNYVPVMAMLRLPTEESGGRANLHAGGIGVGVDLSRGITNYAIQNGNLIETLPDKNVSLAGIPIPYWNDCLLLAAKAAEAAGLGYAGVDIAIDRDDGPLILELNARPGLEIQFANLTPLKARLRRVEGLKIKSIEKKISLAKSLFANDNDPEEEEVSSRTILGVIEKIILLDESGKRHPVMAKVDTGAYRTTIDETLAEKLNLHQPVIRHKDVRGALGKQVRPIIALQMVVRDKLIKTEAFLADRSYMNYDMILGRRDMSGFIVDPHKRPAKEERKS